MISTFGKLKVILCGQNVEFMVEGEWWEITIRARIRS